MAIIPLDRDHLDYHRRKVNALKADTKALWGKMDAVHMICHLRTSVTLSIDDKDVVDRSIPIVRTIGRWLVFDIFTNWPKGKYPSAPQMIPEPTGDFEQERRGLLEAYDRFAAAAVEHPARKTLSPILGPTTLEYWTHAHGVHVNHHYRQFGML
jgi:hypothetical protein